jgi:hypothetical protein
MISQVLDEEIVPRTRDAKRHYAQESECIFGCTQKLVTDPKLLRTVGARRGFCAIFLERSPIESQVSRKTLLKFIP